MSEYTPGKPIALYLVILVVFGLLLSLPQSTFQAAVLDWRAKVDPLVLEETAQAGAGESEFILVMAEQADLSGAAGLDTKLEKGTFVYQRLTEVAAISQAPVIALLKQSQAIYRSYWVANLIWARGDAALVQTLAQRPEVARIDANIKIQAELPQATPQLIGPEGVNGVEWNIQQVNAPQVWSAGYNGQGAVIGGQDTGYDWDHPALIEHYRGWQSASVDHNYSWHDAIHEANANCPADSSEPCDDYGHGTHTMGTMVGDDGAGHQIGMAPGANWIGCRNMDQGAGSPISYTECYQWFIAPTDLAGENPRVDLAPDVINNSWSCTGGEGCNSANLDILQPVVAAVRAAGILTVHSAGNSGPGCETVNTPSAIYAESFTVGATDSGDGIASFSSRGPVTVDGSDRLKPQVVAPGVGVLSSVLGNGYGTNSGTSMAAPHVAGLAALLIDAQPQLAGQVDALEAVIEGAAAPLTTSQNCGGSGNDVPNNTYGWGRVDAYEAMLAVPHGFELSSQPSSFVVAPGATITYPISLTHLHSTDSTSNVILTAEVPSQTDFISASGAYTLVGSSVEWQFPAMAANETAMVSLQVQVQTGYLGMLDSLEYQVTSADVPAPVVGNPVNVFVGFPVYLPLIRQN